MSTTDALIEEGVITWKGKVLGVAFRGYGYTAIKMYKPFLWLPEGDRTMPNPVWDWVSRFCEVEVKFS